MTSSKLRMCSICTWTNQATSSTVVISPTICKRRNGSNTDRRKIIIRHLSTKLYFPAGARKQHTPGQSFRGNYSCFWIYPNFVIARCTGKAEPLFQKQSALYVQPLHWNTGLWQPKSNLVHFSLKTWHLVARILIIFLRINWPDFVHFYD